MAATTTNVFEDESNVIKKLLTLSYDYRQISPSLSSFYMSDLLCFEEGREYFEKKRTIICPFCGTFRTAINSRVRIKPRVKMTKNLKCMQNKLKSKPSKTQKRQKRIIKLWESNSNKIVIDCYNCKKKYRWRLNIPKDIDTKPAPAIEKPKKKRKKRKDTTAGLVLPTSLSKTSTKRIEPKKIMINPVRFVRHNQPAPPDTNIIKANSSNSSKNVSKNSKTAKVSLVFKKEFKKINETNVPSQRQKLESFLLQL